MEFNGILLNDLVNDEGYKELKDLNLTIQNVHILESKMKLVLNMSAPSIVFNESITKLEEMFTSKFEAFEVTVNLIYQDNLKSDLIIEDFIEYIKDITTKKIPSSGTWVSDIELNDIDDNIILYLPNQMSYFSMIKHGLIDYLSKLIDLKIGKRLKVQYKEKSLGIRFDTETDKRVELHLHTQMSAIDGVSNVKKLIERAKSWGHKSIAITDHGVGQAFPDAMEISKSLEMKIIYGIEGYMINDQKIIVTDLYDDREANNFVVFDLETTGLSAKNDMITEIGAVRIVDGKITERFSQLINPEIPIPSKITELTGITNEMVSSMPIIGEVIQSFKDFIKDSILVAHNATFDIGFIREKMKLNNMSIDNLVLDTLELSRAVFPGLKSHKLNLIAKHLDVCLLNHHRALDDAIATSEILVKILNSLKEKKITSLEQINNLNYTQDKTKGEVFNVIILAKNYTGLKNLYKLISDSHTKYFYKKPRMPKSLLDKNRDGLIIGSACESGELYKAILNNKGYTQVREIIRFYDYLEIQPIQNNFHLIRSGLVKDEMELQSINKKIYELGNKFNKIVVATGDVHFLGPDDEIYRRILMEGHDFLNADIQAPPYFKTTNEMLDEFSYLGDNISREVVIDNTNYISDLVEDIIPIFANDKISDLKATNFDYNAISGMTLKIGS